MTTQANADSGNTTLQESYSRVFKRCAQKWVAGGALIIATASGVGYGVYEIATSNMFSREDKTDSTKVLLGLAGIFLSLAGGAGAARPLSRSIDKDHKKLESIQRQMDLNKTFDLTPPSKYKIDPKTGQYETYGEALKNAQISKGLNLLGFGSTLLAGGYSIVNTFARDPLLTDFAYAVAKDLDSSRQLAGIIQVTTGAILLCGTAVFGKKAYDAGVLAGKIEPDVAHFGPNGRKKSPTAAAPTSAGTGGVQEATPS